MLDVSWSRPSLRVERVRFPGGTLVMAFGEVDMTTVAAFEAELCDASRRSDVLVDLSEVSFLGAAAIRVLLQVAAECAMRGHSLLICALRPQHRRLLARLDLLDQLVCPESPPPLTEARPHAD